MHTSEGARTRGANEPPRATDVAVERHAAGPGAPVFLISPASLSGVRGRRLLEGRGSTPVVDRITSGERLPICEIYASISSLYFRGKLAYARRFARSPHSLGVRIITSDRGLYAADDAVGLDDLRCMALAPIDERDLAYRERLTASASELGAELRDGSIVVLLGSVATPKYLGPLGEALGDRLRIPAAFIGLGDMSRGALLLRAVAEGRELDYVEPPVQRLRMSRGPATTARRRAGGRAGR